MLLENYDRLSRQDPWAAIALVNDLRQLGIHVGRLDRMKLLRCDSTDYGDFFEAAIEFMRGNSESAAKSMRNGAAWQRKRKAARERGAVITRRLPAWVREVDGRLELIPERAAAVRRVFELAAAGYGHVLIVKQLTKEGIPPFGESVIREGRRRPAFAGRWTRSYVALLLRDRRAMGEFRPRRSDGTPDGDPLPNYYPAAVTEEEFYAARDGAARRARKPGRMGNHVNLFAGLLRDARTGGSYYVARRVRDFGPHHVLINQSAVEGRAGYRTFPLPTFERAVLEQLKEIDPREVLGEGDGPDEVLALSGELAAVESAIATIEADLDAHGESPTLFKRLRAKEDQKRSLAARLAEARQRAAHPLSESWGECKTLLAALDAAPDQTDARLRLRGVLRRVLASVELLVVPLGRDRLAAAQLWFADGQRCRSYLILHQPPKANGFKRYEGSWSVCSFAEVPWSGQLDLRRPDHARRLERVLLDLDLSAFCQT